MAFATKPPDAIVKVTLEDPLLNTTVLNSLPARFAPAKAMLRSDAELKVTVDDPTDHEAEVEAFVQLPEIVHASEPKAM